MLSFLSEPVSLSSVTRRSAGLPGLVQKLIAMESQGPSRYTSMISDFQTKMNRSKKQVGKNRAVDVLCAGTLISPNR